MTVEELISLNQMITDLTITVRKDGTRLLDELNIGPDAGTKPRFPNKVPIDEKHINNMSATREATYLDKTINAWDDGHDYWQVKPNRVPKAWLGLEVYGWEVWPAYYGRHPRACGHENGRTYHKNQFNGQYLRVTALPNGCKLEAPKEKPKTLDNYECDGQMSFEDWCVEVVNI